MGSNDWDSTDGGWTIGRWGWSRGIGWPHWHWNWMSWNTFVLDISDVSEIVRMIRRTYNRYCHSLLYCFVGACIIFLDTKEVSDNI